VRPALRRVAGPAVLVTTALVTAACGAGGFGGSGQQQEPRPPIRSYVALGDGFAAAPYAGKTAVDRGCYRSAQNYPAQVASRLGVQVTDVSCTGAGTRSMLYRAPAPEGKGQLAAQVDAVTADTDLVTITAGVSDKNLLGRGFYVCMETPCDSYRVPATQLGAEVADVGSAVTAIVRAVQAKAPNAEVVVVGYPAISPPSHGCKGLPEMNDLQLVGVNALFTQLNASLQDTARETGAAFADLSTSTKGHDVCAKEPWIRNPDDPRGKKFPLLPLAPEPKAAADAVMAAVANR
jgi:hypothetical protein